MQRKVRAEPKTNNLGEGRGRVEVNRMLGKKEELSLKAKGFKIAYERWFYGVPFFFIFGGVLNSLGLSLAIVVIFFLASIFCLYQSQKNYSLYKAAKNEDHVRIAPTTAMTQAATDTANQETNYCRHCGQQIVSASSFCEKCGKRLDYQSD